MAGFAKVRRAAAGLPGVEAGTVHGAPALRIGGRLLARAPRRYYLTEHYRRYPAVLVRLSRIDERSLRRLLHSSYAFVTRRGARGRSPPRRGGR
jgi:hypothetical protein